MARPPHACSLAGARKSSLEPAGPTASRKSSRRFAKPAVTAECRTLDVTSLDDMKAFASFAAEKLGPVDVLVNNAGVMPLSPLHELKIDEWNRMIDVNIQGRAPRHRRGPAGHAGAEIRPHHQSLVHRRPSGLGRRAPFTVARSSPGHRHFEGLRLENTDVRVTVISPGVVESELADTISDPGAREAMKDYRKVALTPDAIGRAIAYAIEQPADVDVNERSSSGQRQAPNEQVALRQLHAPTGRYELAHGHARDA